MRGICLQKKHRRFDVWGNKRPEARFGLFVKIGLILYDFFMFSSFILYKFLILYLISFYLP